MFGICADERSRTMERHYQFKSVLNEYSNYYSLITRDDNTAYVEKVDNNNSNNSGLFEFGSLIEAYEFILEDARQ